MKQLKVVHITETFVTGVYSYIRDLSSEIEVDQEIKNIIIYSGKRKGQLNESLPKSTELIELNMVREINFQEDRTSFNKLLKLLKNLEPDIIHVHSSKAGFLGRLASIFLKKKVRVFYTAHGFSFLRRDVSKLKRLFFFFIEKSITLFSNSTIVACGDTELTYAKKLGKAILIRNGVNLDNIRSYCPPKNNSEIVIGILGRISFPRNPELFNKIALKFNTLQFLWIGGGELEEKITAPNIKVTGWFTDKKVGYQYLNSIDIYLQTSLWEGLPIAVLEAMALEKPVVASNVIGNKDAVIHNVTGFLFNDFDEACSYIEQLIENKSLRKKFGEKGLERCDSYFNVNNNFKKLIQAYKNA